METHKFIIDEKYEHTRIDLFLKEKLELSRSYIQKIINEKSVTINSKEINKNYKLRQNDIIEVVIDEPKEINILAENIPLNIIYEDSDLIIINKPQGMVVHPASGHYKKTLVNALMYHCKDELSGINGVLRPGIVHRIDKDTSGALIVAKNDKAHKHLAIQLAEHTIKREYYAIIKNSLKNDTGTVDEPIGRHPVDRKKMAVTHKNSKRAVTHYTMIQKFNKYSLIKLKLETGRTHQIRVHMAYINRPIIGDIVYGDKNQPFKLNGQMLHSKTIGFIHPTSQKYLEFDTELPPHFQNIIDKIK